MMFRFSSKITDNYKYYLNLILAVCFIIIPLCSYAQTYTQSITIENIHSSNREEAQVETDLKNTIHEEIKKENVSDNKEPERVIVIYDTPLSNPYFRPYYNKEIVYIIQKPPSLGTPVSGNYSYRGSNFNYKGNAYNYKGGLYYGSKGNLNVSSVSSSNKIQNNYATPPYNYSSNENNSGIKKTIKYF